MRLFATSPPTPARSSSLPTPWKHVECYLSWYSQYGHHQRGRRFYWSHSLSQKKYSRLFVTQFRCDAVQELFEIYFSAKTLEVSNHVEDGWVFALEAKTLHGRFKLSGIYFSSRLSVKQVKGFFKLFYFVFCETRALDFLLGWGLDSGFGSCGHCNKS